jgi:hypothetical protein
LETLLPPGKQAFSPTSIELGLLILRHVLGRSIVGVLVLSVYCANTKENGSAGENSGRESNREDRDIYGWSCITAA